MPLPLVAGGLWIALQSFIIFVLPQIIGKILLLLGVGGVTYAGVQVLLGNVRSFLEEQISVLPPELYNFFSVLNVGEAFSMILSAVTIKMTMRGMDALGNMRTFRRNNVMGA